MNNQERPRLCYICRQPGHIARDHLNENLGQGAFGAIPPAYRGQIHLHQAPIVYRGGGRRGNRGRFTPYGSSRERTRSATSPSEVNPDEIRPRGNWSPNSTASWGNEGTGESRANRGNEDTGVERADRGNKFTGAEEAVRGKKISGEKEADGAKIAALEARLAVQADKIAQLEAVAKPLPDDDFDLNLDTPMNDRK